jgi:hypothetical protein
MKLKGMGIIWFLDEKLCKPVKERDDRNDACIFF